MNPLQCAGCLLLSIGFVHAAAQANAASMIVTASAGYTASDSFLERAPEAFGGYGNELAMFEKNTGLQIISPTTGSTQLSLGAPSSYLTQYTFGGFCGVWCSFVTAAPDGQSLWVGFTNYGNTDDRIYQVTPGGQWTQKATLTGNFDLEFHGTTAYVSANTSGMAGGDNSLWMLDTETGSTTAFAYVGGYSAGLGVDSVGNVYYGNYGFTPGSQALYRFLADQIQEAVGSDEVLQLADGEKLSDFAANGPYDVDVDAADHVVFNLNSGDQNGSGSSKIAIWNGIAGSGLNYDVIGEGAGSVRWYTMLATTGDITQRSGTVYVQDYFSPGIAQLTATTPEPSTLALVGIAALVGTAFYKKRNALRIRQRELPGTCVG